MTPDDGGPSDAHGALPMCVPACPERLHLFAV